MNPPKAVLGALALALVAGTVQANNPAYWTAKNGWSTEHSCERDDGRKWCWTMTLGRDVAHPGDFEAGASLIYECDTRNGEWLYLSMHSSNSPKRDIRTIKARWRPRRGATLKDDLPTAVTRKHQRGKFLYYYELEDSKDFIEKMKEHRTLTVYLPFPGGQRAEVRLKLANAVPSIQQTMKACHIHRSALGDIHL